MKFQERDGEILLTIFKNDGVLAKRQIKSIFWFDCSWRAMERRLAKLYLNSYISWPSREQRKIYPVPEPICWLGWRGALYIAGKYGVTIKEPKSGNENQLRVLQKNLRDGGIHWVREPRWILLRHDIAVVDFRLAMEKSVGEIPSLIINNWLPESVFRSDMDRVNYSYKNRNGKVVHAKKGVCPDAYFEIIDESRRMSGEPYKARFLLELDMSTHDNPSFGREKAAAGAAYINSSKFRVRFGNNHAIWLVVTNGGDKRMNNLIKQTEDKVKDSAGLFYFTTFGRVNDGNLLTSPVWFRADRNDPGSIFQL